MKKSEFKLNCIYNGDVAEVIKSIPSETIDLIITSPPYFGCRMYGNETIGREEDPNEYIDNLSSIFDKIKRILKPSGSLYLNLGDVYFGTKGFSRNKGTWARGTDKHYAEHKITKEDGKYLQHKQLLMLPSRLAIKLQQNGWILRNNIIWEKPNPIPSHSPDRRLPVYENIFHFSKSKKYYFDYEKCKELNHHRDVIKCGTEAYDFHQATFPEKLIEPFILISSKEGDTVLDPFWGSGTVGVSCIKNKRNFVGIEINKDFCDLSKQRLDEVSSAQNVFFESEDKGVVKIEIIDANGLKKRGRPSKKDLTKPVDMLS